MVEDRCQLIRRGDCCREERDQASNTRRIWACSYGEPLEEGCCVLRLRRRGPKRLSGQVLARHNLCRQQRGDGPWVRRAWSNQALLHCLTGRQTGNKPHLPNPPRPTGHRPETEAARRIEAVVHLLAFCPFCPFENKRIRSPCHYSWAMVLGPCDVSSSSARAWKRVGVKKRPRGWPGRLRDGRHTTPIQLWMPMKLQCDNHQDRGSLSRVGRWRPSNLECRCPIPDTPYR
jgi:hypothetical protein